ncbi:MAG: DNA glycosylase AlkZ-like family protein, partial [Gammaproteobacteria bacterium]
PYAFLDDAPAEERRTNAVHALGLADVHHAAEIGRLDPAAIERVRSEAWPAPRDADELYDALVLTGFMTAGEGERGSAACSPVGTTSAAIADAESRASSLLQDHGRGDFFDELRATKRATAFSPLPSGEGPRVRGTEAASLWVAAERLAEMQSVHPQGSIEPAIEAVASEAAATREGALRELLRSRLESLGPVTMRELADMIGLAETEVAAALAALETEGFVLRGRFTPGATQDEYCDRRLLARIHRYTLKRLRSEIEPAGAADFMRFLFRWQGLGADRGEGVQALLATIERLEGYPIAAAAWERDVIPLRIGDYAPAMLDQLCVSGAVTWMRLAPSTGIRSSALGTSPISLMPRAHRAVWQALMPVRGDDRGLSADAQRVLDALRRDGASFFDDLLDATSLLRSQAEAALAELVVRGLVTADSFAGLRALLRPMRRRASYASRGRRRTSLGGFDSAGRWAMTQSPSVHFEDGELPGPEMVEHVARVLLTRYGVVFRTLLARESVLPPWRELLRVYRRLEARGEIRGGRFVAEVAGEQFAWPEAVGALREMRKQKPAGELISISAADPLNLVGVLAPGDRTPALAGNRILYRDGVPIAARVAGEVRFLADVAPGTEWALRNRLLRRESAPLRAVPGAARG